MTNKMAFTMEASRIKIERILALLKACPLNTLDLAEAIPMSVRWTQVYIKHLRQQKLIYIHRWDVHVQQFERRYPRPVYRAGNHSDAPQPPNMTMKERSSNGWKKLKADPEKHLDTLLRRRAKALKPRQNPLTTWIPRCDHQSHI